MSLERVVSAIKKHSSFLITAHTSLEADAVGSELAFYNIVKKMGKQAVIVNEDALTCGTEFLPGAKSIRRRKGYCRGIQFDCLVALDCADLTRTGQVYKLNVGRKTVLNIDHHISNRRFGDVNWVDSRASCCCEMVYRLHKRLGLKMDSRTALSIYAGIVSDTGSFHYSNTSSFTHQAAAELLRFKIRPERIYGSIYENLSVDDARLLARLLGRMECDKNGKLAWFKIESSLLENKNVCLDLTDHLLSFARSIRGVEVVVLFKQNLGFKNQIRVNLRSQGRVDVNKIAAYFGGGGHKNAAGCTIQGEMRQVVGRCLARVRASLK